MREGRLVRAVAVAGFGLALAAGVALAATRPLEPRLDPGAAPAVSTAVTRVRPAVVGIRARIAPDRPSTATLGAERWGSGVIIEPDGLVLTAGYVVLEAAPLEVVLADGRRVSARVVGHDFESGLGLIRLDGGGPYPTVRLGRSAPVSAGQPVSIVGVGGDERSVAVAAGVTEVRPFVAYWEYMLDQAIVVTPLHPAFGGAALVDPEGALIGIVSLRLPEGHLAIPIDLLAPVRDALVAHGRPARPPRPWLGVRSVAIDGGVGIAGVSPVGAAHAAGLQPGDVVVRFNGDRVVDIADFYRKLWSTAVGSPIELSVYREGRLEPVTVRARDRYTIFQFRTP